MLHQFYTSKISSNVVKSVLKDTWCHEFNTAYIQYGFVDKILLSQLGWRPVSVHGLPSPE